MVFLLVSHCIIIMMMMMMMMTTALSRSPAPDPGWDGKAVPAPRPGPGHIQGLGSLLHLILLGVQMASVSPSINTVMSISSGLVPSRPYARRFKEKTRLLNIKEHTEG